MLTGNQIDEIALPLLTPGQLAIFRDQLDVDFAFSWLDRARIRGSIFTQRGQTALALRVIPARIPNFDDLGLPAAATWVSEQPRGFVLVTGPTGSGKSTTLASIIDKINETRAAHILTIEDPVEYVFPAINQIQTNEAAGLTFATGRRRSPNVKSASTVPPLTGPCARRCARTPMSS